ncbi:MAG: type II toxin-antitoxin system YafQ family toxin [Acidiferrobacterales bacterium]|nr:type II toxin-antitoxin system YafQ family toxin [Acidiferrobacterales bacterium]
MRRIERTVQFRRDYKREIKGRYKPIVESRLNEVLKLLASDIPLDQKYRDHALIGNWRDHRDCHLAPNLVLIYRLVGKECLQLVRIGSHSELGL